MRSRCHRKETLKPRLTKQDRIKTHYYPPYQEYSPIFNDPLPFFRMGNLRCGSLSESRVLFLDLPSFRYLHFYSYGLLTSSLYERTN